jgi:very-short-patch-repair endonuclease
VTKITEEQIAKQKGIKKKKEERKKSLLEFASKLARNLPKSEKWFFEAFKKSGFPRLNSNNQRRVKALRIGKSNKVFQNKYIPDLVNHKLKYIIEIDGSVHQLEEVKRKDERKTRYYMKRGYTVIRIQAYDEESLYKGLIEVAYKFKNYCSYCNDDQWRTYQYFIERIHKKYPNLKPTPKNTGAVLQPEQPIENTIKKQKVVLRKKADRE